MSRSFAAGVLLLCFSFATGWGNPQPPSIEIAGHRFTPPSDWVAGSPLSPMRAAEWGVPPLKGSIEKGEVVAFYFGPGQGGDTKANIDRWRSTMKEPGGGQPDGKVTVREVRGLRITQLYITGTYANSMASPGTPPEPRAGWALLGAIVERPQGAIFFRFTGPEALVESQFMAFTKFVDSVQSVR